MSSAAAIRGEGRVAWRRGRYPWDPGAAGARGTRVHPNCAKCRSSTSDRFHLGDAVEPKADALFLEEDVRLGGGLEELTELAVGLDVDRFG